MRKAVAGNPHTPLQLLQTLVTKKDVDVRLGVVLNSNTPLEALHILATDGDREVRQAVAEHPNNPLEALHTLATDDYSWVREAVAQNSNTPLELLQTLAIDKSWRVRQSVAGNPKTPLEALQILVTDEDYDVRQAVAAHSNTSLEALQTLATERGWFGVREAVAKNPNTPLELLRVLASDEDWDVREAVTLNPNTPLELLRVLASDEDWDVRKAVALNPNTPLELLKILASDKDEKVRLSRAWSPNTPLELLEILASDEDCDVRKAVAKNLNTSLELLRILATDEDVGVRQAVTLNPNTSPETLHTLVTDKSWSVRQAVAKHANTPPETLHILVYDNYWTVRHAVARRPNTSLDLLYILTTDGDEVVRYEVSWNSNTPLEALQTLTTDQDKGVRYWMAWNPNTPLELLHTLATDKSWSVRQAVGRNLNAPRELLKILASDKDVDVRCAVAEHPNTPRELLKILATDKDMDVRLGVASNPNTPLELLKILATATDVVRDVRLARAWNPNTPLELLQTLATDGDRNVRRGVAESPNISLELLKILANDEDRNVRLGVAKRCNTPLEALQILATDEDMDVRGVVAKNPNFSLKCGAGDGREDEDPPTPPHQETARASETATGEGRGHLADLYAARGPDDAPDGTDAAQRLTALAPGGSVGAVKAAARGSRLSGEFPTMTHTLLTHPDPHTLERHALEWLGQHPEARVLLPSTGALEHLRPHLPRSAQTLREFAHHILERSGLTPHAARGCERVLLEGASSLTLEYLGPLLGFGRGLDALLEQLREFLRAHLDPAAVQGVAGSARERDLARLYGAYLAGLRAQGAYDAAVPEAFAAWARLEPQSTLVYGFPYLDAAQRALVHAACGPESLLTLPWDGGEDGGAFREAGRVRMWLLECGWRAHPLEDPEHATPARAFRRGDGLGGHLSHTAPTPEAEVRAALAQLEAQVQAGTPGAALAVVVRDEATYLPLLEELALERGLTLSGGMTVALAETALGSVLLEVLRRLSCGAELHDLASHPLWRETPALESPALAGPSPRQEQAAILWAFLEHHLRLEQPDERHRLCAQQLRQIVLDAGDGEEPLEAKTFLDQLERAVQQAGVPRFPRPGGIQVLTPLGTAGRRFEVAWVLGLSRDRFPAAAAPDTLLDAHCRERWRAAGVGLRDLPERQDLEPALFHLAASSAARTLVLSRPMRDAGGAPLRSSSFWERLGTGQLLEPRAFLPRRLLSEGEARARAEREQARRAGTQGPHGGQLEQPIDPGAWTWSASQLHDFGVCRFRWFAGKVLGLRAPGAARSSDARARGHLAHLTLQVLLEPFVGQRPTPEVLLQALPAALEEAEARASAGGEWIPEPLWPLERRTLLEELRGAVRTWTFIVPGSTVEALEQRVSGRLELGGHTWTLSGIVDRLDLSKEGLSLTDYKSGSYISRVREAGAAEASLEIQLPLYLLLSGAASGRYFSLKRAERLAQVGPTQAGWSEQLERLNGFMAGVAGWMQAGDVAADPGPERKPCGMCDLGAVCRLQAATPEAGAA